MNGFPVILLLTILDNRASLDKIIPKIRTFLPAKVISLFARMSDISIFISRFDYVTLPMVKLQ